MLILCFLFFFLVLCFFGITSIYSWFCFIQHFVAHKNLLTSFIFFVVVCWSFPSQNIMIVYHNLHTMWPSANQIAWCMSPAGTALMHTSSCTEIVIQASRCAFQAQDHRGQVVSSKTLYHRANIFHTHIIFVSGTIKHAKNLLFISITLVQITKFTSL